VVGAGSGGSVVAGRLAEAGRSVLLVEAGGQAPWISHIPAMVGLLQLTDMDWQYKTVKQEGSNLGMGGVSSWPRGRVLGGSSMLNYMLYVRGNKRDYDEWADLGLEGWDWKSVLPYFKKSENFLGKYEGSEEYHGFEGVMGVSPVPYTEPIIDTFLGAATEMGYKIGDFNGDVQDNGFTITHTTTVNGERPGTYKSFAEKFEGGNLTLADFSQATKILMEDGKAVGVEMVRHGFKQEFRCNHEVILSAGAIGSPQLLMLSGIGDKDHLKEMGIPLVHHSPQVGQNLQDHVMASLPFDVPEGWASSPLLPASASSDYKEGKGPLSHCGIPAMAHIHTDINTDPRPDIQLHLASITVATDMGLVLKHNLGIDEKGWESFYQSHTELTTASFFPALSRPKSRGFVQLSSSDPFAHPLIQPNYFSDPHDIKTLTAGLRLSLKLTQTHAMRSAGAELWDFKTEPYCSQLEFDSDEFWECYLRYWAHNHLSSSGHLLHGHCSG